MCMIFKWYIQQVKKVQEQAKVYIQLKFHLMLSNIHLNVTFEVIKCHIQLIS